MANLNSEYGSNVSTLQVEIKVDDQTGKYFLPDDSILRTKQIIEIWMPKNPGGNMTSPKEGRPVILDAILANSFITLLCANIEVWQDHPLSDIAITDEDRRHRELYLHHFNPSKSYVTIAGGTIVNPSSILINFTYLN